MRPICIQIAKVFFSLCVILIIFRYIDPSEVIMGFTNLNFVVFISVLGLFFISQGISALKWKVLLPDESFLVLYKFVFVGQFYSIILPSVTGEVVKGYRFARERGGASRVTASVIMDKITGLMALILLGMVGIVFSHSNVPLLVTIVISTTFVALCFLMYVAQSDFIEKRILRKIIPCKYMEIISTTLNYCRKFSILSITIWKSIAIGVVFQLSLILMSIIIGMKIGFVVSFVDWLWIFSITSLSILPPVTIGGVGIREAIFAAIAISLDIDPKNAVVVSLVMFGFQLIVALCGGLLEFRTFLRKRF